MEQLGRVRLVHAKAVTRLPLLDKTRLAIA